jgi:cell division protein FtsI (penicillin-binding protein 3)
LGILGLGFLLAIALLGLRLIYLQTIEAQEFQARAERQQQTQLTPFVPRRAIVDRRSVAHRQAEYLAVDRPVYTLWARPGRPGSPQQLAQRLSPILERPVPQLREQLVVGQVVRLERWLPENIAHQVVSDLWDLSDQLWLVEERQRVYPAEDEAAEVVGYVDLEHVGQAGVEYSSQDRLEQRSPTATIPRDGLGRLLAAAVPAGFFQSDDTVLQLTLDMRLQRAAREAVRQQMERYRPDRATAIVMDPHTGEILAMASEPTYDPNHYYSFPVNRFRNWAVADLFEPGSTFKPIVVAMALQEGAIQANTRINDEGQISVGGALIQNHDYLQKGVPGLSSISELLQESSNVGMVHISERLGAERFYDEMLKLGLGKPSQVDLASEPPSQIKQRWQFLNVPVESATSAIGQGLALTPLQILQMHAVIANGGYRVTPHIVRGLVDRNTDAFVWKPSFPKPEQIFSAEVCHTVQTMLRDVVDYGTGKPVAIDGYEIGGKTGTAQKPNPDGSGYLPDNFRVTSFVGYFPAINPKYIVLTLADNPKGTQTYGSTVAAPIARSIIEKIVAMELLPPQTSPPTSMTTPTGEPNALDP